MPEEIKQEKNMQTYDESYQPDDIVRFITNSESNSSKFDVKHEEVALELRNIAKKMRQMHHSFDSQRSTRNLEDKITKLSESSTDIYSELILHYKIWKPRREKLIATLKNSTKVLERNCAYVSGFRILTSAADILEILTKKGTENSWTGFTLQTISLLGVAAVLIETGYSRKVLQDIKEAIAEDRKSLKEIIQWYEKTKELDDAIKSFFPYDIDTGIAKIINNRSLEKDDYEKIFMTIVASNGKRNINLLQNEEFLKTVDRVAASEAGKLWFHKAILKEVPFIRRCFESDLHKELRRIFPQLSPNITDQEILLEIGRGLSSKDSVKITVDVVSIIACGCSILYGAQSEVSKSIQALAKCTEEEFKELQNAMCLLKPSDAEVDCKL